MEDGPVAAATKARRRPHQNLTNSSSAPQRPHQSPHQRNYGARFAAGAFAATALLGACGSSAKTASSATQASANSGAAAATAASGGVGSVKVGVGVADAQAASPATGQAVPELPASTRVLIVTASLKLRAADVGDAVNSVTSIAVQQGGNVYNSQVNLEGPASASVEVRVPPFKLADTETAIGKLGTVLGLTQQVQDVTEASADLDARIMTAQASVDRVRGFLDKATTLTDLALLEAQVTQRETTLEQLQAQQRTMAGHTGLSTLTVEISGPEAVIASTSNRRPSIVAGFKGGWNAVVAFVTIVGLVIAAVLPFAVLSAAFVAPAWWLWKRWRAAHPSFVRTARPVPTVPVASGSELPPPL